MAEFGTLDFAVSFSPTTAFPLDSRYYFESLEEANNAASKAVPAGSSDGKYFFGENVVVVADGKATMYIIQPDKTLSEVGEGSSEQQDYTALSNKPSIGGVELNGDMTLDDLGIKQTYTASDISFSDGQTFQQKYDSGDLNGDDGFSPSVQVTTTEDGHTVVITDKTGPHEFLVKNGANGADGDKGEDGFSPIVSVDEIPGGHRVGIQDSTGTETFDVMNGQDGAAGDSGVFYGETEPEDPDVMVWIDPGGGSSPGGLIDDNLISKTSTWSSRMVIDSLAPEFYMSGSIVTCTPVHNYPLSVVSQILPVQDGDGDSGPDNVRPVRGWDGANIWQCGENIADQSLAKNGSIGVEDGKLAINESASYGLYLSCDVNGDIPSITFLGEYEGGVPGRWKICFTDNDNKLVPFTYTYHYPSAGSSTTFLDASGNSSKRLAVISDFSGASKMWVCATDGRTTPPVITVVAGAVPGVVYSKYVGELVAVDFGQKVYGGQLNWTTGELTIEWGTHTFSADDTYGGDCQSSDNSVGCVISINAPARASNITAQEIPDILCSTLATVSYSTIFGKTNDNPTISGVSGATNKQIVVRLPKSIAQTATDIKNWLISNNVSVVYRLETYTTVQLTQQEILALSGTNTLYTNTGDITVSGRADPNAIINDLLLRIDALEKAVITGGV